MATKLQKEANRENAQKSTGPKTPEGKANSAQNAVTHGLTACCNVIEIEDREEFDFFRQEMLDDLYPIGPMQYRLAERIVSLSWRLRRAEIMHDKTIDDLLQKDRDWLYDDMMKYRIHPDLPGDELALGHMAQSDFSKRRSVLDRLIMYERRIENSMYKTMKQLKILKNEPISSTTERQEPRYQLPERSDVNYEELPFPMSPKVEKMISRIRKNLKLDEIQDSNIENKDSNIENPESTIEKMQNEPNYKHYAQESRPTPHESRLMQNEPNLQEHMNDDGWQSRFSGTEGQAMDNSHQQANHESRATTDERSLPAVRVAGDTKKCKTNPIQARFNFIGEWVTLFKVDQWPEVIITIC